MDATAKFVPDDLRHLISSYQRLSGKRFEQSGRGAVTNVAAITDAMDETFLQIVSFPTDDVQVCYRQVELLMTLLAEPETDVASRELLRDVVLTHVRRLAARAESPKAGGVGAAANL